MDKNSQDTNQETEPVCLQKANIPEPFWRNKTPKSKVITFPKNRPEMPPRGKTLAFTTLEDQSPSTNSMASSPTDTHLKESTVRDHYRWLTSVDGKTWRQAFEDSDNSWWILRKARDASITSGHYERVIKIDPMETLITYKNGLPVYGID
jgi:hypothetical protein